MDDRIPESPLPIDPALHDAVEVEWMEYPFPNEYRATIRLERQSADPLLLDIEFTWPTDPGPEGAGYQRKTVAYNVARWYLQVAGVIRAPFKLELEPPLLLGQSSSIHFETNHSGWGQCRVVG
jgi:hypothetical protein